MRAHQTALSSEVMSRCPEYWDSDYCEWLFGMVSCDFEQSTTDRLLFSSWWDGGDVNRVLMGLNSPYGCFFPAWNWAKMQLRPTHTHTHIRTHTQIQQTPASAQLCICWSASSYHCPTVIRVSPDIISIMLTFLQAVFLPKSWCVCVHVCVCVFEYMNACLAATCLASGCCVAKKKGNYVFGVFFFVIV